MFLRTVCQNCEWQIYSDKPKTLAILGHRKCSAQVRERCRLGSIVARYSTVQSHFNEFIQLYIKNLNKGFSIDNSCCFEYTYVTTSLNLST